MRGSRFHIVKKFLPSKIKHLEPRMVGLDALIANKISRKLKQLIMSFIQFFKELGLLARYIHLFYVESLLLVLDCIYCWSFYLCMLSNSWCMDMHIYRVCIVFFCGQHVLCCEEG